MTDARLPERWLNDARLQRVSASAYRLFGNGLMWTVANRTDGHLPAWSLSLIPHATEPDAKELTSVSLWLDHPSDGWIVTDYEATQTTKADLDHLAYQRQQARDRQRRKRSRSAAVTRDIPRDVTADSTRTGQARPGALRGSDRRQDSCADEECSQPPRSGCRTCWEHAYLETA